MRVNNGTGGDGRMLTQKGGLLYIRDGRRKRKYSERMSCFCCIFFCVVVPLQKVETDDITADIAFAFPCGLSLPNSRPSDDRHTRYVVVVVEVVGKYKTRFQISRYFSSHRTLIF